MHFKVILAILLATSTALPSPKPPGGAPKDFDAKAVGEESITELTADVPVQVPAKEHKGSGPKGSKRGSDKKKPKGNETPIEDPESPAEEEVEPNDPFNVPITIQPPQKQEPAPPAQEKPTQKKEPSPPAQEKPAQKKGSAAPAQEKPAQKKESATPAQKKPARKQVPVQENPAQKQDPVTPGKVAPCPIPVPESPVDQGKQGSNNKKRKCKPKASSPRIVNL
jgi:hypothetical protein